MVALVGAIIILTGDPALAHHVRTWGQTTPTNTASWGWCTYGAKQQFKAATDVFPALSGDAHNWDNSARLTGWTVALDAEPRSIVVFEKGVQGASWSAGHVAWVEWVEFQADGRSVHILEMNGSAGFGNYNRRVDVAGMSYVLAP